MAFKLSEIKDPVFEVDFGDQVKSFDPWKVGEEIHDYSINHPEATFYQSIRVGFGFDADDERISRHAALTLHTKLNDFLESLPVSKKLQALTANSSKQG